MSAEVQKAMEKYLDQLLDESSKHVEIPDSQVLDFLVKELVQIAPIDHQGERTTPDIIHWRWGSVLRDALYLGSITQQKANRPDCKGYDTLRDLIRTTIIESFEMGVRDATRRERRTKM